MPSPIAVEGASCRFWIDPFTSARSCVGGTMTAAVPEKATSDTLKPRGSRSTNPWAAVLAASSRLGSTSTASIERDTSMASTTVARSRGTLTLPFGCANATVSEARLSTAATTAT